MKNKLDLSILAQGFLFMGIGIFVIFLIVDFVNIKNTNILDDEIGFRGFVLGCLFFLSGCILNNQYLIIRRIVK